MNTDLLRDMVLTRLPLTLTHELGSYAMSRMSIEVFVEETVQRVRLMVSTELLGSLRIQKEDKRVVEVPKTWWDHLKLSFPRWLAKRLKPVAYDEITFTTKFAEYSTYPKININPPSDFGPMVPLHVTEVHVSEAGWGSIRMPGEEIPLPYRTRSEVMSALYKSRGVHEASPYHLTKFLDALEELGVNVSEMVRR